MKTTEELISEKFNEMTSEDCKYFLDKSLDYCKANFPENWKDDEWYVSIIEVIGKALKNKSLSYNQFKLINRYTQVIDVFNNKTKKW
jgi:hypothetical protein